MSNHDPIEPRIVAHHVGARGYGVSFNVPPRFQRDVVHVLYEADRECVERMLRETDHPHAQALAERHVFPYCLGRVDGPGKLNITANSYASSLFDPDPSFLRYYCEIPIDAAIYDVIYAPMLEVLRKMDVEIRSMDRLFADGLLPGSLSPDFLSLDTQGYELEILKGAEQAVGGVLGMVCEVEMLPIYAGQPLLADVLQHMARREFVFAGFPALFEVAPLRAPVGLRGRGFPAFGDALFLRDLDKLPVQSLGADRAYSMLLKAAFIALCFGHVEYSLDALQRAAKVRPRVDPAWRSRLDGLGYANFLDRMAAVAGRQPPMYPPVHAVPDNSRQPGDSRTSWYDKHHGKAMKMVQPAPAPAAEPPPNPGGGILRSPLARAVRRMLPDWIAAPLRRMLIRDSASVAVAASPAPAAASPASEWPPMQSYTEFEKLLDGAGFTGIMEIVRNRRMVAERYIRALDRTMYREGASAHLARD